MLLAAAAAMSQRQGIITRHMLYTLCQRQHAAIPLIVGYDGHKGFASSTSLLDYHRRNQIWVVMSKDMGVIKESSMRMPWGEGQQTKGSPTEKVGRSIRALPKWGGGV